MTARRLSVCSTVAAVLAAATLTLTPASARADEPGAAATATLAQRSGAPAAAAGGTAAPSPQDTPAPPPVQTEHLVAFRFLAGAGGALISVPATLALGNVLGNSITGSTVGSILLAAVPFIVLVPVAVTGAESLVGERVQRGSSRFHPAIWVAGVANLGMIVAGHFAGVSPIGIDFRSVALFTLVEALVLPAVVTLTMHLSAPRRAAPAPARRARVLRRATVASIAEASAAYAGASARAVEGLRLGDPGAAAAGAPFTLTLWSSSF